MVKALDLKSNGLCPRRFEPCQLRSVFYGDRRFSRQKNKIKLPPVGFEPTTPSLRDWCSTTELKRHIYTIGFGIFTNYLHFKKINNPNDFD